LLPFVLYGTIRQVDSSCKEGGVSFLIKRIGQHPNLVAWFVLSVGMVLMVLYAAKDVGFQTGQMLVLVIATVLLAGACVWIINWE
jgi:hypothetical protein